mmetsp:Transcript_7020/g.15343  ORF Transcript_7020/g.15343 Transcript_7020/m.15343 type:complete len:219 (-) Transcript_7020:1396-2052(-)
MIVTRSTFYPPEPFCLTELALRQAMVAAVVVVVEAFREGSQHQEASTTTAAGGCSTTKEIARDLLPTPAFPTLGAVSTGRAHRMGRRPLTVTTTWTTDVETETEAMVDHPRSNHPTMATTSTTEHRRQSGTTWVSVTEGAMGELLAGTSNNNSNRDNNNNNKTSGVRAVEAVLEAALARPPARPAGARRLRTNASGVVRTGPLATPSLWVQTRIAATY